MTSSDLAHMMPHIYISYRHKDNIIINTLGDIDFDENREVEQTEFSPNSIPDHVREKYEGVVGRIYSKLADAFSPTEIFWDIAAIQEGLIDITQEVQLNINTCDTLVVIIGPEWVNALDSTINQPKDPVRFELENALSRQDVYILPVLLGDTTMPSGREEVWGFATQKSNSEKKEILMPSYLSPLSRKWATVVRTGNEADFETDMSLLIQRLKSRYSRTGGIARVTDFSADFMRYAIAHALDRLQVMNTYTSLLPLFRSSIHKALSQSKSFKVELLFIDPSCEKSAERSRELGYEDENYISKRPFEKYTGRKRRTV
jgi:hypothetical protein